MNVISKVTGLSLCLFCSSCRLLWAEEAPVWTAPVVEEVRMPAGIQGGVFYTEHDEMVIVKPGAWTRPVQVPPQDAGMPAPLASETIKNRITLAGRMKLTEALRLVADSEGKNLVIGPGVEDRDIAPELKDVPVETALAGLLYPTGYGVKITDEGMFILAKDTRVFRLNLPPVVQAFNTTTTNESSTGAASTVSSARTTADSRVRVGAKVVVENSSGTLAYWQDIEANVKNLVSAGGLVSFNKAAGVVVVTDAPRELDRIAAFFKDINARSSEQIQVDLKVIEVELSREHRLGIDWGALASQGSFRGLGFATNFASENMSSGNMMTFTGRVNKDGSGDTQSGVKAVTKALESFGRLEVVSQPRLMMLNNSVASIQVGETRSYVESTNMETTQGGATITSATLNEVHGGVTLQLTGSIVGEDVYLNVTPVVSTIDGIRTIMLGGGNKLEAPDTSMKTMSTLVRVKAGQTVAIGGLITRDRTNQQQGVPFLSKVPVLGKMFSYEVRGDKRTELVIFMTPRRG